LTVDDSSVASRYFADEHLAAIVETRQVRHTLAQLREELISLVDGRGAEWQFDAEINVFSNGIDVYVVDESAFAREAKARSIQLSSMAHTVKVEGLAQPGAAMYGGRAITTCTTAFSVYSAALGKSGLSTAQHCDNSQTYLPTGQSLSFVAENSTTGYDVQWHTRSDATFPNRVWDGNPDWRQIVAVRNRAFQNVGDYACKFGKVTGYGCGNIVSRDATLCQTGGKGAVTGIRVHNNSNANLMDGGDSGMPWFLGETALGVASCIASVSGHGWIDSIYMAANYVESGLNVTIKRTP
jgi:hypothetical protein